MNSESKPHLGIVIVGHVDAGKSTTTGHLMFKLGGLTERQLQKLQEEADANGKGSFAFAYLMDKQKDERERGVTISCTTKEFFTDKWHYTIIDAPGHRDFIKNMISGASQADIALLMVPASKGSFETSIQKGDHKTGKVQGQTRQHARLLKLLGVEQIIVGINKMDDPSVKYSESRYNEIKTEVSAMLTKIGYKMGRVPVIPLSGFKGENLVDKSENMPWYKGFDVQISKKDKVHGHTLYDALNNVVKPPKRRIEHPFKMPVSGVYKIKGVGDVICGCVEQGVLKPDTKIRFIPSGATGKAFTIEMHHKNQLQAQCGDNVGVNVKGLSGLPKVGDVMVVANDTSKAISQFTATVSVQEHPGKLYATDEKHGGFCPVVHVRTSKCACRMVKINWKQGKKSTGGIKMENPNYVKQFDTAEIVFEPTYPMALSTYADCPGLGRIAVMDSNSLKMLGRINNVVEKEDK